MRYYKLSNDQTEFLDEYRPKDWGVTSFKEIKEVKTRLGIGTAVKEQDLQHLRNAVVKFYSEKMYANESDHRQVMSYMDSMQSVTAVIDTMLYHY